MKKKISLRLALALFVFISACQKTDWMPDIKNGGDNDNKSLSHAKKYPAKVAFDWINLQQNLSKTTPGFGPGVVGRAFSYSGLALYESVLPGMPSYQSYLSRVTGQVYAIDKKKDYYWPASANAAMAEIIRNLFASTSAQNKASIDALETSNYASYQGAAPLDQLEASAAYGKMIAKAVFEWSKTDGYLDPVPPFTMPVGPGYWIPTPPAFGPPVATNWGTFRSFYPGIADKTQPGAPLPYSENPSSDFYKMANYVYEVSQNLANDDILLAKTWADIPGNYNGQGHFTNVLTQLLGENNANLELAAYAYAKHGMALADAAISVFKTKYKYLLIRPVSYIRNVIGKPTWNTVIPTPSHPEYSAAHATLSGASQKILESLFGKKYAFIDHTHDALYGPRSYTSFEDYANQSGWSRVLAGVHYKPSVDVALVSGRKVGDYINSIPLKK
jgi:hypothetical protein